MQINDVKVIRGIGDGCDEEALRVMKMMPNWNPGKQRGQEVRVEFKMPIVFKLNDNNESPQSEETINAGDQLFQVVEVMPEYPGGDKALFKFIGQNIEYPASAKKAGTTGRVFINFVIEKDGNVSNIKIKKGIGDGCDEEAIRVINMMPKWTPGTQRGENVRVAYNLPINFVLN